MEYYDPLKNYENRPNPESKWLAVSVIICTLAIVALVYHNYKVSAPKIKKKSDF